MKLYRLKNKNNTGWWVVADSPEEAVRISLSAERARRPENITVVGDQTEHYRTTTNLDTITHKGIAYLMINPSTSTTPTHKWCVSPRG
jgi:hypothetical protein